MALAAVTSAVAGMVSGYTCNQALRRGVKRWLALLIFAMPIGAAFMGAYTTPLAFVLILALVAICLRVISLTPAPIFMPAMVAVLQAADGEPPFDVPEAMVHRTVCRACERPVWAPQSLVSAATAFGPTRILCADCTARERPDM